jgi:Protein of unknown function (DUF2705)
MMLINKGLLIFTIITFLIQAGLMHSFNIFDSDIPFLDGIPLGVSFSIETIYLLYWYLPIAGISFYFSGYLREHLLSYGQLVIIREYSKVKWVLKRYIEVCVQLFMFVIMQLLVFYIFSFINGYINFNNFSIYLLLLYYLMLLVIICCQLVFELYTSPELSQVVISVYIVLSTFLSSRLYSMHSIKDLNYLLIINYGMGFRTGLSDNSLMRDVIYYPFGYILLLLFLLFLVALTIKKVKKMEIK